MEERNTIRDAVCVLIKESVWSCLSFLRKVEREETTRVLVS
jgi:hypothetical protein